jgi:hypothetical protein
MVCSRDLKGPYILRESKMGQTRGCYHGSPQKWVKTAPSPGLPVCQKLPQVDRNRRFCSVNDNQCITFCLTLPHRVFETGRDLATQ